MNSARPAQVSVIVVTREAGARLARCLQALRTEAGSAAAQVIVVRNGPEPPNTEDEDLPGWVERVDSPVNLGFAGGLALGRSAARGAFLAIVQDDVQLQPGWMGLLVRDLMADPALGAVGGRIDYPDGSSDAGWVLDPIQGYRAAAEVILQGAAAAPRRVEGLNSAAVMVRAEAWDSCGGPDRRLFPVQYVDFDLCLCLLTGGWGIAVDARAAARHLRHGSLDGRPLSYVRWRNHRRWRQNWRDVFARIFPTPVAGEASIEAGLGRAAADVHPGVGCRPKAGQRGPAPLRALVRQARRQNLELRLALVLIWPWLRILRDLHLRRSGQGR